MKPVNFNYYSQVDQTEQELFRNWLIDHLRFGPVTVTFKKKDGTERVMKCTLNEQLVPAYENKTERKKEPNIEVCPVYDLDNAGWRSFRFDSITQVEFTLE